MQNVRRMTAVQFSGLTDPEALYSENEDYRTSARAVQNGHAVNVRDEPDGDSHLVTVTYETDDDEWVFEILYPVYKQDIGEGACRPEHSYFNNVYIDMPLSSLFIGSRLSFKNCVFGTDVKMTEVMEFNASNCIMLHDTMAIGDKVLNSICLRRCILCDKFAMRSCVISSDITFEKCDFLAEFLITVVNIGGDINMVGNIFTKILTIMQSSLNGMYLFTGNQCNLYLMDRCFLNNGSSMENSEFSEQFMMINCKLHADASFDNITLPYADLSSNNFSTLTISDCYCSDTISFIDSRFDNDVVLTRVHSPKVDFLRTKITAMMKIDGIPERFGTRNRSPGEITETCVDVLDFRDATVMGFLVLKNCYKELDLSDCRISGGIDIDWDYLNIIEGRFIRKANPNCRIRNATSDTMMTLYEAMTNNKRYADAEKYFQAYNLIKRFEPKHGKVPRFPLMSYLHELISGFGRSPKRLFVFVVWLILAYGLVYYFLGLGSLQNSVYFSGITFFTIGFNEVGVMTFPIKMVTIAEGFSGVFSMSYLIASLTRKNI